TAKTKTSTSELESSIPSPKLESWADKDSKIPRSILLKGYSNWTEGYISTMLKVDLSSESPYIQDTHCTCKAGLGHCNQVVAVPQSC
ncbi:hypothetical protein PO909_002602, partial [Leuciscus waleckii]